MLLLFDCIKQLKSIYKLFIIYNIYKIIHNIAFNDITIVAEESISHFIETIFCSDADNYNIQSRTSQRCL